MGMAIPVGLIVFACMILIFRFVLNPDMSSLKKLDYDKLRNSVDPMDKR